MKRTIMFFITFIFLFSFLGPIVNIVDAQFSPPPPPIANAEIVMGEGYDDQVEFTGTKTVSGTEWDVYRITLDSDGETKIYFDASNSSSGVETNQWKILFDAPYGGEASTLEGHTFTEPADNGTWGYVFKNATVDSTGENENTIRMELVVDDDLNQSSEKFRMFFVIVPYGLVDDEPVDGMRGMPAPNLVGEAYNGSGWQNFDLQTYYDYDWSIDNNDTKDSQWVMIQFLDTDCPYCFTDAQDYQEASQYFTPINSESPWNGPHVSFIASAAELTGLKGHESSREEIVAFRDKTTGEMCNSGNVDCSERDGGAFQFPFIDDLDKSHMNKWGIGGTPTYFLIQPNCIIAWSSFDNQDEKFYEAINRLVPQDGAANNYDQMPQIDSDGDGIPDCTDLFPNNVNETQDSDGDGVGDNSDAFPNDGNETHDDDDDGVGNNTDAFPQDGNETHDDDNDGVGNNTDAFPQDGNETMDTDQDGVGDNEDPEPENPDVRTPQDISVEISDTSSYLIAGSIMLLALVILFVRRKQPPNTIAKSHFVEEESIWNNS